MTVTWYYARGPKATFGFEVADGKVITCAPYGRKWLLGKDARKAIALLRAHGYQVKQGSP